MEHGAVVVVEISDPTRPVPLESDGDVLLVEPGTAVSDDVLHQMVAALAASERHGLVTAARDSPAVTTLPAYSLTPVARPGCVLVRRRLIDSHGLLDLQAPSMSAALADLSLRLDRLGYSTVVANRAAVPGVSSPGLSPVDRAWLAARHPASSRQIDSLGSRMTDPLEWFADVIATDEQIKVLVDLTHVAPLQNGTSKVALAFVDYVRQHVDRERFEVVLAAHSDVEQLFDLARHGLRIVRPSEVDERFHIGYVPTQVFTLDDLRLLDRWCARIIVTDLDIISVRSINLLAAKPDRIATFFDAFRWADRTIAISEASRRDALEYFVELDDDAASRFVTIPQGYVPPTSREAGAGTSASFAKGEYVLVVGNWLPHKALGEALSALSGELDRPIVVLGGGRGLASTNIHPLPSGTLGDSDVEQLVRDSAVVVFPSVYEGFGLPIAEAAAYRRPVVLSDTAVSREVAALFAERAPAFFASTFRELPAAVKEALSASAPTQDAPLRTIDDYSREVWDVIELVAHEPVDADRLRRRQTYFRQVESYLAASQGGSIAFRVRRWLEQHRSSSPRLYRLAYQLAWRAGRVRAR